MKRFRRFFYKSFLILVILGCISILAGAGIKIYMEVSMRDFIYTEEEIEKLVDIDYIIVPGAQIIGEEPSLYLQKRLDMAIKLYQNGIANTIVVSGGNQNEEHREEADVMKNYLVKNGIPADIIYKDYGGKNTYQTMYRSVLFFKGKKAVITTQKMYTARSAYLARTVGLEAVVIESDLGSYTSNPFAYFREFLAPTKAFLYRVFQPEPKYSLEELPFVK